MSTICHKIHFFTLYHSLVESRLRYCSTVWGNCNNALKANLQRIHNRAARIITCTEYGSVDSEALLRKLGWLNVQQLIDFNTAVMVHKSINNTPPSYLSECFTKPSAIHSHNSRSANRAIFPTHTNTLPGCCYFNSAPVTLILLSWRYSLPSSSRSLL